MTGLDLSEEFIAEARQASPHPIRWVQDDMRSLPWVSTFDGAYCFGNSFGYLAWDESLEFLSAVARVLKPGARFIVDTGMAAESILPSLARNQRGSVWAICSCSAKIATIRPKAASISITLSCAAARWKHGPPVAMYSRWANSAECTRRLDSAPWNCWHQPVEKLTSLGLQG